MLFHRNFAKKSSDKVCTSELVFSSSWPNYKFFTEVSVKFRLVSLCWYQLFYQQISLTEIILHEVRQCLHISQELNFWLKIIEHVFLLLCLSHLMNKQFPWTPGRSVPVIFNLIFLVICYVII